MIRFLPFGVGLALASTSALASQPADCIMTADADYPGTAITVTVNGVASVTSSTVAHALSALAMTDPTDTVTLSSNADGDSALSQAQTCILTGGRVTWSMARLFHVSPPHRVHSALFELERPKGTVALNHSKKLANSASGQMTLQFFDGTSQACLTVAFDAYAFGPDDYFVTGLSHNGESVKNTCAGVKCRACKFDSDTCHCTNAVGSDPSESYCNHTVTEDEEFTFGVGGHYLGG